MAALRFSRFEFADPHEDEDGNLYLDVPEPLTKKTFKTDGRFVVGEGEDLWTAAWRGYRSILARLTDSEQDVRPTGFWTVIAQVNDVVDPLSNPPELGSILSVPSVDTLFGEILAPPRFFSRNTVT